MDLVGAGNCLQIYPSLYNRNQHNVNPFSHFLSAWQPPKDMSAYFSVQVELLFSLMEMGVALATSLRCHSHVVNKTLLIVPCAPHERSPLQTATLCQIISTSCCGRGPLQHLHAPRFDLQCLGQLFLRRTDLGLQISHSFRDVHFQIQICYSLFLSFFMQF